MRQIQTLTLLVVVLAGLVLMASCKKKNPQACFTVSKTELYTKDTLYLSNCSTDAGRYTWDFGDGNTSGETNPTKVYSDTGWFNVSLNARTTSYYNANSSDYSVPVHVTKGVRGCMDPTSCNYNPRANIDDGSCQFAGRYTFYMSNTGYSFVEMNVDGSYVGTISQHYASIPQADCATVAGCVRVETCAGVSHTYQGIVYDATGSIIKTVSGIFNVTAGGCQSFAIN